jgi:hypothetical protein
MYNNEDSGMKWDKLSLNSSLAFYQKRPWLCPKYFIPQSLEKIYPLRSQTYFSFCPFVSFSFSRMSGVRPRPGWERAFLGGSWGGGVQVCEMENQFINSFLDRIYMTLMDMRHDS